jgi:hypothetical protein
MKKRLGLSMLFLLIAGCWSVMAQKPANKYKPPKLVTQLGTAKDSVALSPEEIGKLVSMPLLITDAAGGKYEISSYQLAYKRMAYVEDEETGKVSPANSVVAELFRQTPLSKIWIIQIQDQIHQGESLIFFDVFVKDTKGRILRAPDLKLVAQ